MNNLKNQFNKFQQVIAVGNKRKDIRNLMRSVGEITDQTRRLVIKKINRRDEDLVVSQSSKLASTITWSLMGGTCLGILWLGTAKTEEIIVATGKLEPISGTVEVQMPLEGIAKNIKVRDGDRVEKGEILVELDSETSVDQVRVLEESLSLKNQELSLKLKELKKSKEISISKINKLESQLGFSIGIRDLYKDLVEQGAAARLKLLENEEKVSQLQGDITIAIKDQEKVVNVLEQSIQNISSQIAQLEGKLTQAKVTLKYQAIHAPIGGIVFDSKVLTSGFVARSSEPIMKIVPIDQLQANVEVQSNNIGFIRLGNKVDISIDSFPATDFGTIKGSIIKIGSDALPPDPRSSKGYRYPTTIKLDNQRLGLKSGEDLPLKVGMSLTANIKLRTVTYLQLLLGSFKDKADSLRAL